jgi:hypothetical protein
MIEGRFCSPTACSLRLAMIGISARPGGSLGKMLHQFCEQAEGATSRFLLQVLAAAIGPGRLRTAWPTPGQGPPSGFGALRTTVNHITLDRSQPGLPRRT